MVYSCNCGCIKEVTDSDKNFSYSEEETYNTYQEELYHKITFDKKCEKCKEENKIIFHFFSLYGSIFYDEVDEHGCSVLRNPRLEKFSKNLI